VSAQRFYEDFVVGETWASPSRTLTDAHFFAFAGLSGDNHPIHYDDAYAAKGHFGKRVTHGLLLAGMTALGGSPMSAELDDSMLAFVEQRTRFLKPALIGDTVTPMFEVTAVEPKSGEKAIVRLRVTIVRADGERLLEGEHVYLIKGRRWKAAA
jgi:acyl dehydratase